MMWGEVASCCSPVSGDPSGRRYGFAISKENPDCSVDAFVLKDLAGAAHEIGHIIADGGWCDHPADYGNAYELMDSCYPCFTGAFTRVPSSVLGDAGPSCYSGWIPEARVEIFSPDVGGTAVIAPIELDPDDPTSPMVLKVETAAEGLFYLAECHRLISWDDIAPILSEGTSILEVTAGASPPTEVMQPPGATWGDGL